MKNKVWLLVLTVFLFMVGCNQQSAIKGEYIDSKEELELVYEPKAYENYLSLSEKEKQEILKKLIEDNRHLKGIKEIKLKDEEHDISMLNITESEFSGNLADGTSIEPVKISDKFEEVEVQNVYKEKNVMEDTEKEIGKYANYYVFSKGQLSLVSEGENHLIIHSFYSKASKEYESVMKLQDERHQAFADLGITGDYVPVGKRELISLNKNNLLEIFESEDLDKINNVLLEVLDSKNTKYSRKESSTSSHIKMISVGDKENFTINSENAKPISVEINGVSKDDLRIYDGGDQLGIMVYKENMLYHLFISKPNKSNLIITKFYKKDSEEYSQAVASYEKEKKADAESIAKEKAKAESRAREKAKAESESIAREKAESESRAEEARKKAAEEEARKKAEEERKKNFSPDNYTAMSYEEAMRNEKAWFFYNVKISGKVLQVQNGDNAVHYRIGTQNNGYDGVFLVEIAKDNLDNRILEDDWVTVYGRSFGVTEYTTVMNAKREIPAIVADKITID